MLCGWNREWGAVPQSLSEGRDLPLAPFGAERVRWAAHRGSCLSHYLLLPAHDSTPPLLAPRCPLGGNQNQRASLPNALFIAFEAQKSRRLSLSLTGSLVRLPRGRWGMGAKGGGRKHTRTKALQNPPSPGLHDAPNQCQLLAEVSPPLCLSYSPQGQTKGRLLQGLLIALRTPLQSSRSPGALDRCHSAVHSSCHFRLRRGVCRTRVCVCTFMSQLPTEAMGAVLPHCSGA